LPQKLILNIMADTNYIEPPAELLKTILERIRSEERALFLMRSFVSSMAVLVVVFGIGGGILYTKSQTQSVGAHNVAIETLATKNLSENSKNSDLLDISNVSEGNRNFSIQYPYTFSKTIFYSVSR